MVKKQQQKRENQNLRGQNGDRAFKNSARLMTATVVALGVLPFSVPVFAQEQTTKGCPAAIQAIGNQATFTYQNNTDTDVISSVSNQANTKESDNTQAVQVVSAGVRNAQGTLLAGAAFGSLVGQLRQLGFTESEASAGAIALTDQATNLSDNTTVTQFLNQTKAAILAAAPNKKDAIENLYGANSGAVGLQLITQLFRAILVPANLTGVETEQATQAALSVLLASSDGAFNRSTLETAFQSASAAVPAKSSQLQPALDAFLQGSQNFRSQVSAGDILNFDFLITNTDKTTRTFNLIDANNPNAPLKTIVVPTQSQIRVTIAIEVGTVPTVGETVGASLLRNEQNLQVFLMGSGTLSGVTAQNPAAIATCPTNTPADQPTEQIVVIIPPAPTREPLVDPLGKITGCAGETLPEYEGFSVGLYEPDPNDATGGIGDAVALTPTGEGTDNEGLEPNIVNSNPFFLSSGDEGRYNFLFDVNRGQLDPGDTYILIVNPPEDSVFSERRIRIVIDSRDGNLVTYTATSLDGRPISATNDETSLQQSFRIEDANRVGLVFAVLDIDPNVCQAQEIQITKTGDRAAAEPGDTVIYRLLVRNLSSSPLNNLVVTDELPRGFQLRDDSVRAEVEKQRVAIATNNGGSTITFSATGISLPPEKVLTIAYAVTLTPDALRGSGENSAIVQGQRTQPPLNVVRDGPALFRLQLRPGIVADAGTIIGRVFEDKNFDGEQQNGEPGIPNAIVFLDDGTRIVTDVNGLFSIANVLPGYRSGVLDLSSLPGYTLAPNLYFEERNSQSRLVRLEPGGLVRMNFAVTPAFREEKKQ